MDGLMMDEWISSTHLISAWGLLSWGGGGGGRGRVGGWLDPRLVWFHPLHSFIAVHLRNE